MKIVIQILSDSTVGLKWMQLFLIKCLQNNFRIKRILWVQ